MEGVMAENDQSRAGGTTYKVHGENGRTFDPAKTALLVIDPVNDFLAEEGAAWELTQEQGDQARRDRSPPPAHRRCPGGGDPGRRAPRPRHGPVTAPVRQARGPAVNRSGPEGSGRRCQTAGRPFVWHKTADDILERPLWISSATGALRTNRSAHTLAVEAPGAGEQGGRCGRFRDSEATVALARPGWGRRGSRTDLAGPVKVRTSTPGDAPAEV